MKYLKMIIMPLLLLTVVHATTQNKKYVTCMIHDRVKGIKFNYYYIDCGTSKMDMLLVDEKYIKGLLSINGPIGT